MPPSPKRKPLSPVLEKRRAAETFFSTMGNTILIFLTGGLLVLLSLFGRQLYGILIGR